MAFQRELLIQCSQHCPSSFSLRAQWAKTKYRMGKMTDTKNLDELAAQLKTASLATDLVRACRLHAAPEERAVALREVLQVRLVALLAEGVLDGEVPSP
jgi:hypothetical protein